MWFTNALIFQYELDNPADLTTALLEEHLKPCPPHARFIYGWLPPVLNSLSHDIIDASLICLGKEERVLPRSVIKRELAERVKTLEATRGFDVKRAERAQMAEDIEFEFLPKAFCLQKRLLAILDIVSKRLIINTASVTQAAQLTALLLKSVPGIHIKPLLSTHNLAWQFSEWIKNPLSLPKNFELASDCVLFSPDNEKKRLHCKGYELPSEEILSLLEQGLVVGEVSLLWNERVQFTVTTDLTFKRLKCLDYLHDDFNDIRQLDDEHLQQDASLTLLTGELRALFNGLLNHFEESMKTTSNLVTI